MRVYMCMYICIYLYTHTCVYDYINIFKYVTIHVCIYIYIHTTKTWSWELIEQKYQQKSERTIWLRFTPAIILFSQDQMYKAMTMLHDFKEGEAWADGQVGLHKPPSCLSATQAEQNGCYDIDGETRAHLQVWRTTWHDKQGEKRAAHSRNVEDE